jgi:endonuclease YncB( thermonuclease family)
MRFLFVAIIAAVVCVPAHAADVQTITARVVGVHDGDTITVAYEDCWLIEGPVASDMAVRNWLR